MSKIVEFIKPGSLAQPDFETGIKTRAGVAYRTLWQVPALRPALERGKRLSDSGDLPDELALLRKRFCDLGQDGTIEPRAFKLFGRNVLFFKDAKMADGTRQNRMHLRVSTYHLDMWTRDRVLAGMAIDDAVIRRSLSDQTAHERFGEHVPSLRLLGNERVFRFDDESTMLAMIDMAEMRKLGVEFRPQEKEVWQQRLGWIQSHVQDGRYISQPGVDHSWHDTFKLDSPAVFGYNQLVYAACLLHARGMGLTVKASDINQAIAACQSYSTQSGRLTMTSTNWFRDVSVFFGEFCARKVGDSLVPESWIRNTADGFASRSNLWPVLTDCDGSFLSPELFNMPKVNRRGWYQNGGVWLKWNAIATDVIHRGRSAAGRFKLDLLADMSDRKKDPEFLVADGSGEDAGTKRRFDVGNAINYQLARNCG